MKPAGRYGPREHAWWVAALGGLHDVDGPGGEHRLDRRRLDAHWPVGCYIATDLDNRVLYVGRVNRATGGFTERFIAHRQPVDGWHRVWLLPMRLGLPAHVVSVIEALLIWRLRPEANRVQPDPVLHIIRP